MIQVEIQEKYFDEESLELIQKKLQKKIKDLRNDNKFLESLADNNISFDKIILNSIEKDELRGKKERNGKLAFSSNNIFSHYKKNNINNNNYKNFDKLNINSSQQKLSDDSSFLEDSSLSQKNKKKIGIGDRI